MLKELLYQETIQLYSTTSSDIGAFFPSAIVTIPPTSQSKLRNTFQLTQLVALYCKKYKYKLLNRQTDNETAHHSKVPYSYSNKGRPRISYCAGTSWQRAFCKNAIYAADGFTCAVPSFHSSHPKFHCTKVRNLMIPSEQWCRL
jgi:hypothetical protein